MKLYLRNATWWARWTEGGRTSRRSTKKSDREAAVEVVESWGLRIPVPRRGPAFGRIILRAGIVYFVEAVGSGRVKIGWTGQDLARRLDQLRTGCPFPVKLLAAVPGRQRDEQATHVALGADRVHGEWFALSADVQTYIAERKSLGSFDCAVGVPDREAWRRISGTKGEL